MIARVNDAVKYVKTPWKSTILRLPVREYTSSFGTNTATGTLSLLKADSMEMTKRIKKRQDMCS